MHIDFGKPVDAEGRLFVGAEIRLPNADETLGILRAIDDGDDDAVVTAIAGLAELMPNEGGDGTPMLDVLDDMPVNAVMRIRDEVIKELMSYERVDVRDNSLLQTLKYPVKLRDDGLQIEAIEYVIPTYGQIREALREREVSGRFYAVVRNTGRAILSTGENEPMVESYARALVGPDVSVIVAEVIPVFFG